MFTPEEIERLQAWAQSALQDGPTFADARDGAIVLVMLGTAARRFEACALRCDSFRRAHDGPVCDFPVRKGGQSGTVAITQDTYDAVQRWLVWKHNFGEDLRGSAPLFCGRRGESMARETLHHRLELRFRQLKIRRRDRLVVHATRHAAGFLLLRATGSLELVREFLQHTNIATTARFYRHIWRPDLRAALKKAGM